mgnify:CR=1 FL=1
MTGLLPPQEKNAEVVLDSSSRLQNSPVVDHFFAEDLSSDDDNLQLVHMDFEREMTMYTDVKLNFIISFLISRALEHQRAAALAKRLK